MIRPVLYGANWYLPGRIRWSHVCPPEGRPELKPVLLFSSLDTNITSSNILRSIKEFAASDDVFSSAFLSQFLVVQTLNSQSLDSTALENNLQGSKPLEDNVWKIRRIHHVEANSQEELLPSGPYFLCGSTLREAWRLYPDTQQSFQTAVVPEELSDEANDQCPPYLDWAKIQKQAQSFKALNLLVPSDGNLAVAVPSRCYSKATTQRPLAGLRVSVKDNYALAGLKTSNQCKSFLETYDAETVTAAYIQRLIDLGAVIVGKTKLTAFASSEKPCDWWEFQCPFNARGDGFLNPGQSTTGGATAAGAYPWLDMSIGSDTFGSVREPAAQNAVFGIRLTTDLAPIDGVYPSSPVFDSIGLLGRNLELVRDLIRWSIAPAQANITSFPKEILYPEDFFPSAGKEQQHIVDEFVSSLESFLEVTKKTIHIAETWNQNPPKSARNRTYAEFTQKMAYNPFYYDGFHEYDSFREDHWIKFEKKVYVSPHMQWKWDLGAEVKKDDRDQSVKDIKIFKQWFDETFMKRDEQTGSSAILIMPVGPGAPNYRDQFIVPTPRIGLDALNIGAVLRLPQVVLPVSQIPYHSRITGREEALPIAVSMAGASGSDLVLLNLAVNLFKASKRSTKVKTGRYAF